MSLSAGQHCDHEDPDHWGVCIKCGATLDPFIDLLREALMETQLDTRPCPLCDGKGTTLGAMPDRGNPACSLCKGGGRVSVTPPETMSPYAEAYHHLYYDSDGDASRLKSRLHGSDAGEYYFAAQMNILAERIADWRARKGFETSLDNLQEKLLLLHSEVTEMVEAQRDGHMGTTLNADGGKPEGFPAECADLLIRVLDICAALDINIAAEVALKMLFNETRPHKHGKRY